MNGRHVNIKSRKHRLSFESLESKRLFAVDVLINSGDVHIAGQSGDIASDDIYITGRVDPVTSHRFFEVFHKDVGDPTYSLCTSANTECTLTGSSSVFTHQITSIHVFLDDPIGFGANGGDDILDLRHVKPEFGFDLPVTTTAPGGGESIHIEGYYGHDTIYGSAFADCIKTGEPTYTRDNDWVFAGDGDDYIEGKAGSDHLEGEGGNDMIFGFYNDGYTDTDAAIHDRDDFIYGGAGDDQIFDSWGSSNSSTGDVLNGGPGVDTYFLAPDSQPDKIVDELIRDANGLGDFNGDGETDRNWIDYPTNVGNVTIEFDHDYTSAVDAVMFEVDKSGDPASPVGTVGNRPDGARHALLETIDAMFDALEDGTFLAQWDFNNDMVLKGYDSDVNASDSDAKEFIHVIVGTTLGDANLDGICNANDINVIGTHWLESGVETWADGDLNGDGVVDVEDLNLTGIYWQQ